MERLIILVFFIKISLCYSQENTGLIKIKQLYEKKDCHALIPACTAELKKDQQNKNIRIEILHYRADCYMTELKFRDAVSDWHELIKLKPNEVNFYNSLAYAYWSLGLIDSALMMISRAYQYDSLDLMTLSNLTFYSAQSGNFEDAVNYATQGLKLEPSKERKATLLNNRGLGYIGMHEYQKALDDINESIRINSHNSYQFFHRALANIGLNRLETVCEDLEKAKNLGGINMTKEYIDTYCK